MLPEKELFKEYDLQFHAPITVGEALRLLDEMAGDVSLIAGATDLMPRMRNGMVSFRNLVSLVGIQELTQLRLGEGGELILGPMVTHGDLEKSTLIRERWPILAEAATTISCRSIRNAGTIGGNICNASPAADLAPSLLALGARITIRNVDGERTVPVIDFFTSPGKTILEPSEMVTAIVVPPVLGGWGDSYLKLGSRKAMEISTVSVGAGLALDKNGMCKAARIALGAVGPVPFRVIKAEQILEGNKLEMDSGEVIAAAQAAAEEAWPITDIRASSEYRRAMVTVLTRRALSRALERSKGVYKS